MNRFEYTDPDGDTLAVYPAETEQGHVVVHRIHGHRNTEPLDLAVYVPLAMLEEIIAGQRDMARQAGGQAEPARCDNANCAGPCPGCYQPPTTPRRFCLLRHTDIAGVSGTGIVADGVLWPDGTASLRWKGEKPSTVHWDRIADAEAVHGHGGATEIVWLDQP
ncbi:hypothetical protein OOK31_25420 [Streptomyces sp. NBC_00249]|uniref:hypothetical protein n=1 Tax=Streptomyces sp. NBC_00249 TaxID=2975690 RepID=UPI002251C6A0|nr:hypothetical protein [Streptomyces sp. NBC_00249]MCX5197197.1 hypothetical protein [Streptomyces sp. NBC_00249]